MSTEENNIVLKITIRIKNDEYCRSYPLYPVPSLLQEQAKNIEQSVHLEISAIARKIRIAERALHGYSVSVGVAATCNDFATTRNFKGYAVKNNHLTADGSSLSDWLILTAVSSTQFATAMDGFY